MNFFFSSLARPRGLDLWGCLPSSQVQRASSAAERGLSVLPPLSRLQRLLRSGGGSLGEALIRDPINRGEPRRVIYSVQFISLRSIRCALHVETNDMSRSTNARKPFSGPRIYYI